MFIVLIPNKAVAQKAQEPPKKKDDSVEIPKKKDDSVASEVSASV